MWCLHESINKHTWTGDNKSPDWIGTMIMTLISRDLRIRSANNLSASLTQPTEGGWKGLLILIVYSKSESMENNDLSLICLKSRVFVLMQFISPPPRRARFDGTQFIKRPQGEGCSFTSMGLLEVISASPIHECLFIIAIEYRVVV